MLGLRRLVLCAGIRSQCRAASSAAATSQGSKDPSSATPSSEAASPRAQRTYTLLTPELAEATTACIAETFSQQDEAFTWALNLKRHHWHSLTIPFIERAANATPALSVVCLNQATGKVDGACIIEDWLAPRPLAYRGEHLATEWWPVRAIFSELHMRFMDSVDVAPRERGHTLRVAYFSGVHPEARRSGVVAGLWGAAVEVARNNGYTSITAQVTSEASRKTLRDELGFMEVAAVPFEDFVVAPEDAGRAGASYTGAVFRDLCKRSPAPARLSIHRRSVPSDLY